MDQQRVGVGVDDFRLPVKEALRWAARLGFGAVQIGVARGQASPGQMSQSGRRHLVRACHTLGLSMAALADEPGGPGISDAAAADAHVERARMILELAADLGVAVVAANVGPVLDPVTGEPAPLAVEALRAIAEQADRVGTVYALQTGVDAPRGMRGALEALDCPWVRACLDPAQLACCGHDPVQAVAVLADWIALAHVADATMGGPAGGGVETRLGLGQIDLPAYLAELAGTACGGPLILRCRRSPEPVQDLAWARRQLESLVP